MTRLLGRHRKGAALIAVICVLALLVVYLVTAQSAVRIMNNMGRVSSGRLDRAEAAIAVLARVVDRPSTQTTSMTIAAPHGLEARVTLAPVATDESMRLRLYPIALRPGDRRVTIQWVGEQTPDRPERWLLNVDGRRAGPIRLGGDDDLNEQNTDGNRNP